jgi:hypothetical protein
LWDNGTKEKEISGGRVRLQNCNRQF